MLYQFWRIGALLWVVSLTPRVVNADVITFSNTDAITIPSVGNANPYPSTIAVSGVAGLMKDFSLTLSGISHSFSDDIAAAVVSPTGTAVLLFSGAGASGSQAGPHDVISQTWTFNDHALVTLPKLTQPSSGTYRPGLDEYGDSFPAPGPNTTYGFTFSPYLSQNVNGQWRLFIIDTVDGDSGIVAGGWSMSFTTAVPESSTTLLFALCSSTGVASCIRRRFRGSLIANVCRQRASRSGSSFQNQTP